MTTRGLIQDLSAKPSAESGGATLAERIPPQQPECLSLASRRMRYHRDTRRYNKR